MTLYSKQGDPLMKEKFIMHSDINHCYAPIEEMKNPLLKEIAMCLGDNKASHNGLVLAKNLKARTFNIQTGESLRDAK